jgi:leukotriene-A4 hydrolase
VLVRNIAQSWTGNQVTPNNWEDYWLNEGFTTFIERHVLAQLYDYNFAATEAYIGNNSLATETNIIGVADKTYVTLHPVLHGDNPDNSFTIVPFEKGFQFLQWIEDFVLGYYHMEDFLEYYIVMNSLTSINQFQLRDTFSSFIQTYYPNADRDNSLLQSIQFTQWIYETGPDPTGLLDFTNPYTTAAKNLALAYIAAGGNDTPENY